MSEYINFTKEEREQARRTDLASFLISQGEKIKKSGSEYEWLDGSQKVTVEADLADLKAILERTKDKEMSDGEIDEMKAAKEKLMNDAQALFAKVYEQAQGAAGQAGPDMGDMGGFSGATGAGQGGSGDDDDIIDGDFREV